MKTWVRTRLITDVNIGSVEAGPPHVSGLLVVVDVVDISSQAEVGDLHHVIFCDENVSGCQVSVNTLKRERRLHDMNAYSKIKPI